MGIESKSKIRIVAVITIIASALTAVTSFAGDKRHSEPRLSGPAPISARLISEKQYANAITYIFGPSIDVEVDFPPVRRVDGLVAIGSATAEMTPSIFAIYDRVARAVATQVTDEQHRSALIPCHPKDISRADENCAKKFLNQTGRLLFRRTLDDAELSRYVDIANTSSAKLGDFFAGLRSALSGMLVAPEFIYYVERNEPDPDRPGHFRLDAHSKALRLSLLLWDSIPDNQLLHAAESGELHDSDGLTKQVERMLSHTRKLETGVKAFFEDFLVLEEFDQLAKDSILYPSFNSKVAQDAKEQTVRIIIDHLLHKNGSYPALFTSRKVFLTQALGPIYGVAVRAAGPQDWVDYTLPEGSPRAGLLTQVGYLSVYSHPGRSSPTLRGKALRETFLCQEVPDPPPNVDFNIFQDPNAVFSTARDRLTAHNTDPTCRGCHMLTDPIGLGMETFDTAGQYRKAENGVVIDASGDLDGVQYKDAADLGRVLSKHPVLAECVVERLFEYGTGRELGDKDRLLVAYLTDQFEVKEYRFKDLLKTIVKGEAFYQVSENAGGQAEIDSSMTAVSNE